MDKFKNQLKDKNVNDLSEEYQLDFIGKDYARRQAGEMPSTVIVPDENWGKPINLMTFGAGDNFIKLSELKDYDFNKPSFNFYGGAVY